MTIKERYAGVLRYFEESGLEAETELLYGNPFELLVAVVLSAQCTDRRVNIVTQREGQALSGSSRNSGESFCGGGSREQG